MSVLEEPTMSLIRVGGNRFLWNMGTCLSNHRASHPNRTYWCWYCCPRQFRNVYCWTHVILFSRLEIYHEDGDSVTKLHAILTQKTRIWMLPIVETTDIMYPSRTSISSLNAVILNLILLYKCDAVPVTCFICTETFHSPGLSSRSSFLYILPHICPPLKLI
jgi:hypothetical protein